MPETIKKYWGAPGTGKTTRLELEIDTLLDTGYSKDDFIVCTFRRKMADELKERLGWDKGQGTINTIHGVCRMLSNIDKVVDEKAKAQFCEQQQIPYFKEKTASPDDDSIPIITSKSKLGNLFFDAVSFLKNNLYPYEKTYWYSEYDRLESFVLSPIDFLEDTESAYTQYKITNNLHDFDDMLLSVYNHRNAPSGRVLVVDEFQDLTPLQYEIIKIWEESMDMVLIAGDPRQTIYGYRGSSSKFFDEHEGELIVLSTTYRLPEKVWNFSKAIVERANLQCPSIKTTGKPGLLKSIPEAEYYQHINAPAFQENIFHLVRINEQGLKIAHALIHAGIPFSGIAGWGSNQICLYNALLKVRKAMRDEQVTFTKDEITELLDTYPKSDFSIQKSIIKEQLKLIKVGKGIPFRDIKEYSTLDIFGKRKLWHQINSDAVLENTLSPYNDPKGTPHIKISHAIRNYSKPITTPSVYVSTIHGAKGSEARTVFLHDAITKKISKKLYESYEQDAIESEAQVFYVGASRAIESLFIVESSGSYRYALPIIKDEEVS